MAFFDSDGLRIHYQDEGSGPTVVLVHGFASRAAYNWGITGWIELLARQYRAVALDCRGHGASDKPHCPGEYGVQKMSGDIVRLLDHLGVRRTLLMGYSMGARLSLELLVSHPQRLRAVVLGGIGAGGGMEDPARRAAIVEALLATDTASVTAATPRLFRLFAEAHQNDLKALAACMAAERTPLDPSRLSAVRLPVMIVVGVDDTLVGDAAALARMIPASQFVRLKGRNHLNAPGDRLYKNLVLRFFASAPP